MKKLQHYNIREKRWQVLSLEVILELKEQLRHMKKVTNKQVDGIETTFGRTRLLEEISSREEVEEDS